VDDHDFRPTRLRSIAATATGCAIAIAIAAVVIAPHIDNGPPPRDPHVISVLPPPVSSEFTFGHGIAATPDHTALYVADAPLDQNKVGGYVARYSMTGRLQWVRHLGAGDELWDGDGGISVGPDGSVAVGWSEADRDCPQNELNADTRLACERTKPQHVFVTEVSPAGQVQRIVPVPGLSGDSVGRQIALAGDGTVYVAGQSQTTPSGGGDTVCGCSDPEAELLQAIGPSGGVTWSRTMGEGIGINLLAWAARRDDLLLEQSTHTDEQLVTVGAGGRVEQTADLPLRGYGAILATRDGDIELPGVDLDSNVLDVVTVSPNGRADIGPVIATGETTARAAQLLPDGQLVIDAQRDGDNGSGELVGVARTGFRTWKLDVPESGIDLDGLAALADGRLAVTSLGSDDTHTVFGAKLLRDGSAGYNPGEQVVLLRSPNAS
jgi:hypothetical protein